MLIMCLLTTIMIYLLLYNYLVDKNRVRRRLLYVTFYK